MHQRLLNETNADEGDDSDSSNEQMVRIVLTVYTEKTVVRSNSGYEISYEWL